MVLRLAVRPTSEPKAGLSQGKTMQLPAHSPQAAALNVGIHLGADALAKVIGDEFLGITRHCAQLTGQKMIRRPGAA